MICFIVCLDLDVVTNIQTSSSTHDSLTVTFTPATGKKDEYSVRCYPDDKDKGRIGSPKETTTTCTSSCICTGLTPGQIYKIEVSTKRAGFPDQTAKGEGPFKTGKIDTITVQCDRKNLRTQTQVICNLPQTLLN